MDGAMGPENAEFPYRKAWVASTCHRSCKEDVSDLELFENSGLVLASGLFPSVREGLCCL